MQGTHLDDYERFTGDSQGIVVDLASQKKTRKCDANGWALFATSTKLIKIHIHPSSEIDY